MWCRLTAQRPTALRAASQFRFTVPALRISVMSEVIKRCAS
jgi:hypothetical protein